MKELGKKMLTPCAGLPLAITLLAGLLAKKNTVSDWNTIYENVCVYISRGIGHQEEEHASASWVLALSYDDLPNASPMGKIRRLAIYLGETADQFVPPRHEAGGGHLRFLFFVSPKNYGWRLIIPSMFKDFKLLRVLKIEGNLICLQTLDFRVWNDCMVIPNVIWKMNRLRHLYLPKWYRASGKLQLSTLGDLQTLHSISSGCCDLNDVIKTKESKETDNKIGVKAMEKSGENLGSCRQRAQLYSLPSQGRPNGKTREAAKPEKSCAVGGKFGKNTNYWFSSNGSFPRLQFLTLAWLEDIREWRVEEGATPSLCRLVIEACRGLSRVPDGVRHLTTLKEVTIERMPGEFCSKVEEGGEDFHKIQHVPSLVIRNPWYALRNDIV
ncbi:hypothetical protein M0R45_018437 [Rubus argutus]|uniref:NB-ARC domain-containing protein n=1 Tax=Rubus argutus TaxID=59490 RepID=A0AAW1X459_RUBAR